MVKLPGNLSLDLGEVDDHAVAVKLRCPHVDGDMPLVAVQAAALALVVKRQAVRRGKGNFLDYCIHFGSAKDRVPESPVFYHLQGKDFSPRKRKRSPRRRNTDKSKDLGIMRDD